MFKDYYSLAKPGLVYGNLIPVIAGFALGAEGGFSTSTFFILAATMIGIAFVMASGCVFNNYIDRDIDAEMERTKDRPLVTGRISGASAIFYGLCLGFIGFYALLVYTNWLAAIVAGFGFFAYIVLYSGWGKRSTIYGPQVGALAGAVPPIVGYTAASGWLDVGAVILFAIIFFWQIPHFFAIAMYRADDYEAAEIPVLPVKKGLLATKASILLYIAAFIVANSMLTISGYLGYRYLLFSLIFGLLWFAFGITGFFAHDEKRWARKMFFLSLIVMVAIFVGITLAAIA